MVGRAARAIAREARGAGIPAGSVRPITVWPFADKEIRTLCAGARRVVVMENNLGQMLPYVEAAVGGSAEVKGLPPAVLGTLHRPGDVLAEIRKGI
jgi:2-oxoglutarate ferredoxin oxidoreductase subunit alpha